ncbi:MAG: hypothetical protein ACFCVA_04240 [Gammaproteobacteria bacterium]
MKQQMSERVHAFLQDGDNLQRLRDWFFESALAEEIANDSSLTEQQITERLHRIFETDLERIVVSYLESQEAP